MYFFSHLLALNENDDIWKSWKRVKNLRNKEKVLLTQKKTSWIKGWCGEASSSSKEKTASIVNENNKYRQRKKEAKGIACTNTDTSTMTPGPKIAEDGSYKTTSALNKAVAKLKRAAPGTLPKKKQAVAKYLKTFDAEDVNEMVGISQKKCKGTRAISASLVSEIEGRFFFFVF